MDLEKKQRQLEKRKKNIKKQRIISNVKLRILGFIFVSMIIFLCGVVFYLKTAYGEEYEMTSMSNLAKRSSKDVKINANRGNILDKYKRSMAVSKPVYNIIFDIKKHIAVKKVSDKEKTLNGLNSYLGIPIATLEEYIVNEPDSMYKVLAKEISKERADEIKEANLKNVYIEESAKRYYRNENYAAQLIGFFRETGGYGLEGYYNRTLTGIAGRMLRTFSESTSLETKYLEPEQGGHLITNIDFEIQKIAQDIADRAGQEFEAGNASVIVTNPMTGQILAMGQYPNFDLNHPADVEFINDLALKEMWDSLSVDERGNELNRIWSNFAITSTFEPGSIYKPIVVAAALEDGIISEEDTFYCGGEKIVSGERIPCHFAPGHGNQSLAAVLANSCNVGMMDIIEEMGYETYYKYQRDFGFGEKTGIDLPNEVSSFNLIYSESQLKNTVNLATSSMGQGFNSTAIQMAAAFGATINGGKLMKPYVVSEIVDSNGQILKSFEPVIMRKVVSEETSDKVRLMLQKVVMPSGTGRNAVIQGYNIGGKTGTAQQGNRDDKLYTVSFIGYLTVENPEIMVMAIIDLPKTETEVQGSTSAAPMLREALLNIIKYKGIQPSGEVSPDDNINFEKDSFEMPELTGLSIENATEKLKNLGVDFEFGGSKGRTIKSQSPVSGEKITKDSLVYLYLEGAEDSIEGLVKMPNIIGIDTLFAEEIITSSGFIPYIVDASEISSNTIYNIDSPTTYYNATENIENTIEPVTETTSETLNEEVTNGTEVINEEVTNGTEVINEVVSESKKVISQSPGPDVYIPKGTYVKIKIE